MKTSDYEPISDDDYAYLTEVMSARGRPRDEERSPSLLWLPSERDRVTDERPTARTTRSRTR